MKKIRFTPARGKYLIEVSPTEDISKGGILLPDQAKERPMEGKIVSVGPFRSSDNKAGNIDYHLSDFVVFGKYSGTEVTVDEKNYLIVDEDDILGVKNLKN